MTELRHLQMVILSIMKDIDDLCQRNGIEYYLLGGSAIGAVRHKGFIPWDDDLDIIMTAANYDKFIEVCKKELDETKYFLQIGLEDWPLYFTKVKLKGTHFREIENKNSDCDGIFIDIFRLDNAPSNTVSRFFQYIAAKIFTCYQLGERSYQSAGWNKKIMIILSFPLKCKFLRTIIKRYIEHYNKEESRYLAFFYGRTNFKTSFVEKKIYGSPQRIPFEDMMLPVPEHYDEYLTQMFGDYMTPPPLEKQVGLHLVDVDFGNY